MAGSVLPAAADPGGNGRFRDDIDVSFAADAGGNSANSARLVRNGVFVAVGPIVSGVPTSLRITNTGTTTDTATITVYDATSGASLATWTSPAVSALASLQIDAASLIAAATPAIPPAGAAGPFNFAIHAGFAGTVQLLTLTGNVLANVSNCDNLRTARGVFGGVPGPGNADLLGMLRIVNSSTQSRTVTLTLRGSADGSSLGTWTSPSVPAHATFAITSNALAAGATPTVPTTTASFTVVATPSGGGVRIDYLAQPRTGGPIASLSAVCRLKGGAKLRTAAAERDDEQSPERNRRSEDGDDDAAR